MNSKSIDPSGSFPLILIKLLFLRLRDWFCWSQSLSGAFLINSLPVLEAIFALRMQCQQHPGYHSRWVLQFYHADDHVATLKHTLPGRLEHHHSTFTSGASGTISHFLNDLKNTAGSFTLSHVHCHSGKSRGRGIPLEEGGVLHEKALQGKTALLLDVSHSRKTAEAKR